METELAAPAGPRRSRGRASPTGRSSPADAVGQDRRFGGASGQQADHAALHMALQLRGTMAQIQAQLARAQQRFSRSVVALARASLTRRMRRRTAWSRPAWPAGQPREVGPEERGSASNGAPAYRQAIALDADLAEAISGWGTCCSSPERSTRRRRRLHGCPARPEIALALPGGDVRADGADARGDRTTRSDATRRARSVPEAQSRRSRSAGSRRPAAIGWRRRRASPRSGPNAGGRPEDPWWA